MGIASVLSGAVLRFPRGLFSLFTDDAEILSMSAMYAPVVAVMLMSSAFCAPMNGLINGSGNFRLNFLLAILDGVAGHIGLAALLGFGLGLAIQGLWYGNVSALLTKYAFFASLRY